MSSRIIEAKFQALDRTIRLLNTTSSLRAKVASTDQLRQLAYAHQRERGAVEAAATNRGSDARSSTPRTVERPHTARKSSPLRFTVRRDGSHNENAWSRQNAWNEANDSALSQQNRQHASPEAPVHCNQLLHSSSVPPVGATAVSLQKLRTTTLKARPHSASTPPPPKAPDLDRQRTPRSARAEVDPAKTAGRNWFVPQTARLRSAPRKTKKITPHHEDPLAPVSFPKEEPTPAQCEAVAAASKMPISLADDPSFYYLELRLNHSLPLTTWRFRATFTDLSVVTHPTIVMDNIPVDAENCLLFSNSDRVASRHPTIIRFFDPVYHFPHVTKPCDLYGHRIHILVKSTMPVARVVIDTVVHFLVDAEPAITAPMSPPSPQCLPLNDSQPETIRIAIPHVPVMPKLDADCSAWEIDDFDGGGEGHSTTQRSVDRATPVKGTTDKKKIQLQQMRATMRRKLREETQQLQRDLRTVTPRR